ncbi:MAG: SMC-Scp complex subunit ScpB [Planctomycetes bacterium]|nr:SMC-Scp complex subunit ScpB [Planctomycetota bacterium]
MPDDIDHTAQEVVEPTDADGETAPAQSESIRESETAVDQTSAPAQEGEVSPDADAPLTQGERQIDQVIGVLLGEPQGTAQAGNGLAEEGQAATEVQEPPAQVQAQEQEATLQPEFVPTTESVLEAILFATDEPLTDSKLAGIVEITAKQVRESIEALNAKYAAENHAFRIEQIAGGYQMLTLNTYNFWLKKMLRARSDNKLSPAAMETLAIIAYKQPIIRADIEAIRGVAVGEVLRSLMYKGLVKITGRAEILGHPMLYGTTKKFLEIFGLNSLKDLPKAEELKNPDRA